MILKWQRDWRVFTDEATETTTIEYTEASHVGRRGAAFKVTNNATPKQVASFMLSFIVYLDSNPLFAVEEGYPVPLVDL